jgi:hypothetical protein
MSNGELIIVRPNTPDDVIFWLDFERGHREPPASIIEMVIEGPVVRGELTYLGHLRTVYMSRDWERPVFPLNESAVHLCGYPFYGPLVINILKRY